MDLTVSHGKFEEILFPAENRVVGSYTDSLLIAAEEGRECLLLGDVWSITKNCGGGAKEGHRSIVKIKQSLKEKKERKNNLERRQKILNKNKEAKNTRSHIPHCP